MHRAFVLGICMLVPVPVLGEFVDHAELEPILAAPGEPAGGGVAFLDFDGDGDLDLAVAHGTGGLRLYENGGAERYEFSDVTEAAGLAGGPERAGGLAAADLDRDGDVDLVVTDRLEGVHVFENRGGVFVDTTALAIDRPRDAQGVAAGDVDGDGWIDLWVGGTFVWNDGRFHHCGPDQLFHNRGDGTFEEVAEAWGVADRGCTLAVLLSDYDLDGDLDLFVANDFGTFVLGNRLHRNDGLGDDGEMRFTDVSRASGFDRRIYGMGIATADVSGDGWPDYFVTSTGRAVLLIGAPDGVFTDVTERYGVTSTFSYEALRATWGAAFLDVEQDGVLDLSVAAGWIGLTSENPVDPVQPSLLFSEVTGVAPASDRGSELGVAPEEASRGLAVGDFDDDGDDDLLTAALGGPVQLFRNDAEAGAVLRVRLEGTVSNRDAIGARVALRCAGVVRTRELVLGGSYGSSHDPEVRLPLAGCGDGGLLEIRWPSGLVEWIDVDGEPATMERTEPAFLSVTPEWLPADGTSEATVRVTPLATDGTPRGPGLDVVIASAGADVGSVADLGDGTYEATVTAPLAPGSAALVVTVGGAELPAHPRVRFFPAGGDRTLVRASPAYYTEGGRPVTVTVVPRDEAGVPDGPGRTITLDLERGSIERPVRDLGDGRYEALVRGEGGGPIRITARVDGLARGPVARVDEIRAIDPAESLVRVVPCAVPRAALEADEEPTVMVLVSPRTELGQPVEDAAAHEYELRGPLGPMTPVGESRAEVRYLATLRASELEDAGLVEVRVDGVLLDTRADLLVFDDPAEVAEAVDPDRSLLGPYQETVHADGEDLIWFNARLANARGHTLPWVDGLSLASGGLTLREERLRVQGTEYRARMRATGEPGDHAVEVEFDGAPLGVSTFVRLLPPRDHVLGALGVRTCLEATWAPADGRTSVRVLVRPHDAAGFLVGSGVPLAVYVDGVERRTDYSMPGTYVATVPPAREPGRATVQTELRGTGRGSTTFVELVAEGDEPRDPEREPCVEIEEGFVPPGRDAGADAGQNGGTDGEDAGGRRDSGGESARLAARGDGCACRAPGRPSGPSRWIALVLVLGMSRMRGLARDRRRRAPGPRCDDAPPTHHRD